VLLTTLTLTSCKESGEEINIDVKIFEINTILTTGGYTVTELSYGQAFDYIRQDIYLKYDVDFEIHTVSKGYVDETEEEEIRVVFFRSNEDSKVFEELIENDTDLGDIFVYKEDRVVVYSTSEDVINLFD